MLNKKALAASVSAPPAEYVEDVFSTYLYTGTGTTQTITNNIDLAGEGGMVWTKTRGGTENHWVYSTAQGTGGTGLITNTTDSSSAYSNYNNMSSFNADGFTLGTASAGNQSNPNGTTAVSWTFRKAPKFFDVVTYTGNGSTQNISHNLGSVPGMIIVKRTNSGGTNWNVYHRSTGADNFLRLNTTDAVANNTTIWNNTTPTSTQFTVGNLGAVNGSGDTYVAYLFAHNAGGFGAAGTDNVISCGSVTTDGSGNATVNLGYEPQFLLIKRTDASGGNWAILDNMRGLTNSAGGDALLYADLSAAEVSYSTDYVGATSTGFYTNGFYGGSTHSYIYMAIRRPMKTPTSGTEVFSPQTWTGNGTSYSITGVSFSPDLALTACRSNSATTYQTLVGDRLRGTPSLCTNATDSEATIGSSDYISYDQTGVTISGNGYSNVLNRTYISWLFSRRPGFFDVVCYTGTGSAQNITHNLGVVPEMMIVKSRNTGSTSWMTYHKDVNGGVNPQNYYLLLQGTGTPVALTAVWNDTAPTSSVFTVGSQGSSGASGRTYVAYLFATVAGVSKVGSYTGNGSSQTINCGFTSGARFILIRDTGGGQWYVWDSARGIVSGNDPYLVLNSTVAENNWGAADDIDPDSSGFIVNNTGTNGINITNGNYIYLAIA